MDAKDGCLLLHAVQGEVIRCSGGLYAIEKGYMDAHYSRFSGFCHPLLKLESFGLSSEQKKAYHEQNFTKVYLMVMRIASRHGLV